MTQDTDSVATPLAGRAYEIDTQRLAHQYGASLLRSLGATVAATVPTTDNPGARKTRYNLDCYQDWADSGLMHLTGFAHQPPAFGPGCIPSCARGALKALQLLSKLPFPANLDGAKMLSERAAYLQLSRSGKVSANQSCRMIATSDGWVALNLARDDDWHLLTALFCISTSVDDWQSVETQAKACSTEAMLTQGRTLGLAIADATEHPGGAPTTWCELHTIGPKAAAPTKHKRPLVVDLSSLWAGPLCSQLLRYANARVIKLESTQRPDGARLATQAGYAEFFDLMNERKSSVALDFTSAQGRDQLLGLLAKADIVIEGSRPRALQQLGIDAEQLVRNKPGLVWLSLTGYGRQEPQANWVAFGDDAAVAAGIAARLDQGPAFCGDALADPLAGLHGALAALAYWQAGQGALLNVSLYGVARHCLDYAQKEFEFSAGAMAIGQQQEDWYLNLEGSSVKINRPRVRAPGNKAAALGADTDKTLLKWNLQ